MHDIKFTVQPAEWLAIHELFDSELVLPQPTLPLLYLHNHCIQQDLQLSVQPLLCSSMERVHVLC